MTGSPIHPTDDGLAVEWLMSLLASTGDIYVRPIAGGPTMETSLREELGLDSIGMVGVFYAVVDELGLDADERVVADWRTVADVVRFARSGAEGAA
ncbi:MAG: acyl carrier protein [Polyangiales bacterium]